MGAHRRSRSPNNGRVFSDFEEDVVQSLYQDKDENNQKDIQLPKHDYPRFFLLVMLYFIQGIPIGLAFGSVPFLLKSNNLSYSQVGFFSLASYPYSLKIIWSPIVDSCYLSHIGKRRSWIIPIQTISGISLIFLGLKIDSWISDNSLILQNLSLLSISFFFLILMCATQDIAVDGWALTILSKNALSYASTAQTIGLNTGYFVSFTIFLAFNSKDFMNKYFRSVPQNRGFVTLGEYMIFSGLLYLAITIFISLFVPENPPNIKIDLDNIEMNSMSNTEYNVNKIEFNITDDEEDDSIKSVYYKMFNVLKLPNIQLFIALHLVCKIAFQANEGATNLKLLDKGFSREDLAITVLIDFPFEIIFGYYAARWSNSDEPLKPWRYGYLGRIIAAILGQVLVYSFPKNGEISNSYFLFVIVQHLLTSFMSTIQFVSICSFHTKIADPLIGGTYMTMLNTLSNFGGQWPKIIVLYLIDKFSYSQCVNSTNSPLDKNIFIDKPFYSCYANEMKNLCVENGGNCVNIKDGYYFTNFLCIIVGIVLYYLWIKKTVKKIETLPIGSWRVKEKGVKNGIRSHLPL